MIRSENLETLADVIDSSGETLPYDPADLVEFFSDGFGNGHYFHRRSRDDADPPIVLWDHETWTLEPAPEFFEVLEATLVRVEDAE